MGNFVINGSSLNNTYVYDDENVIVQGNYTLDAKQGNALQKISGSVYKKNGQGEQGEYIGNFNGYVREGGEIRYSISEMSRRNANMTWDAIDAIEAEITSVNAE